MQHMVLSLPTRVCGGLLVHSLIENSSCVPTGHHELLKRVTVPYAACTQLYSPEDEYLNARNVQRNIIFYE